MKHRELISESSVASSLTAGSVSLGFHNLTQPKEPKSIDFTVN